MDDKYKPEIMLEILTIKSTQERILVHHAEFKVMFEKWAGKMEVLDKVIQDEKLKNAEQIANVKEQIQSAQLKIMTAILGGALLFILGIIMWLVQTNKSTQAWFDSIASIIV